MAKRKKVNKKTLDEVSFIRAGAPKKLGRPKGPPKPYKALTIRFDPDMYDSLWKVCAHRRIDRTEPYSMQNVIKEAVAQWIKKHPVKK